MGMFDTIIVPKSYLKGLLTKEQESLLKTKKRFGGSVRGIEFQTKCLENALSTYKIYRQKLFINDQSLWNCEPPNTEQRTEDTPKKYPYEKGRWSQVGHDESVAFYTSIKDKNENLETFMRKRLEKMSLRHKTEPGVGRTGKQTFYKVI